jgi:hypothetical protein
MKPDQRNLIILDLKKYLPKDGEMAETEKRIWSDLLKKMDYRVAKKAFEKLWVESPPCDNFSRLPDSRKFEEIYEQLTKPKIKHCSCCGGSTFLVFKHKDGRELAHDCKCYLDAGFTPRTPKFSDCGWSECDSIDCPNPGKKEKMVVSKKSYRYFKKLMGTCRHVKTITEKVDKPVDNNEFSTDRVSDSVKDMPDAELPGHGEEELPF